MTAVLSVFLLCLACGAYCFGRLDVGGKDALILYGRLEIGIALSALPVGWILIFQRSWIGAQLPDSDHFLISLLFQLLGALLFLGIPTVLMGGTLPVMVNAARQWVPARRAAVQLYGWNTLGAACGTFASGFFMIWKMGFWGTLMVAVLLNLLAGCTALFLAGRAPGKAPEVVTEEVLPGRPGQGTKGMLGPVLAFLSGFSLLGYELFWGRMAKFLLGDRTLAITSLLFVFIACLGISSLVAPILGRKFGCEKSEQTFNLIAWILLLGAALHLFLVPLAASTIEGHGLTSLLTIPNEFLRRIVTVGVIVAPPVLVLGLVFPLLVWSAGEINHAPGRVMGRLYLVSTMGGVSGAILASYALARWIGTLGGFLVLTGLLVGTSFLMFLLAGSARRWPQVAACLLAGGLMLTGYGFPEDLVHLREDERLLAANEDEYGVQVVALTEQNRMRVRNNRLHLVYELGHPQTTHAQQMAAHLAVLLARESRDVLNIGTGYGITAGTFTLYDDVHSIETIEILPFLVRHQPLFSDYNFEYWTDPRVSIIQGDGRHRLLVSSRLYDIISVNVLDPYLPGSSSLYTVDFWKMVRDHLRPGGVLTQLFWGQDVPRLVKGLKTVFPVVLYFPAYDGTSYNIVAFNEDITQTQLRLHVSRLGPRARQQVREMTSRDPETLFPDLVRSAWDNRRKARRSGRQHSGATSYGRFPGS